MDIKNISFIEVRSPEAYIFRKFPIPRVGPVLLSTMMRQRGYTVSLFVEDVAPVDWGIIENSDLVCISTITSTVADAYRMGDRLKAKGIPVVMGGAHPTFMAEEALGHCDYVTRGEAEESLFALIAHLEKGAPSLSSIEGLSYRDKGGTVVHNAPARLIADLDSLPTPDITLMRGWKPSLVHPVSTQRGCAFVCNFCLVSSMFGRGYRYRSVEPIVEELKRITRRSKAPVFIVDDNFASRPSRTKELLRAMKAEKITPRWSAMVRADLYRDKELVRLLADTGRFTASIGFESVNPDTLKEYKKKQSQEDNLRCVKTLKEHGIKIHGMFVFGADSDTLETIKKTAAFAMETGIDSVQFMLLTPLPGTPIFDEWLQSGRILHLDWKKYDIHHVVFTPAQLDAKTLHLETIKSMQEFYSWKYIAGRLITAELFYAAFGVYNRQNLSRALKEARKYFQSLPAEPSLAGPGSVQATSGQRGGSG